MLLALATAFALLTSGPVVHPVTLEGRPFLATFNAAKDHPRLVGVFSPRCAHCLSTCAKVQEVLRDYSDKELRVFIMWAPFESGDNIGWARRAAARYLPDRRVVHFWDVWKFASRAYVDILRVPPCQAWGLLLGFPPGVEWGEEVPRPLFWFQSRGLQVGTPFTEKLLRMRLKPWLEGDGE